MHHVMHAAISKPLVSRGISGATFLGGLGLIGDGQVVVGGPAPEIAPSPDNVFPIVRPRLLDGGDMLSDGRLYWSILSLAQASLVTNALISRQARSMGAGRSCGSVGDDLNTAHLDYSWRMVRWFRRRPVLRPAAAFTT